MSKKACPLCDRKIKEKDYLYHNEVEEVLIDLIRKNHPNWVQKDGACPMCVEYYRAIFSQEKEGQ